MRSLRLPRRRVLSRPLRGGTDFGIFFPGLFHVFGFWQGLEIGFDFRVELQFCVEGRPRRSFISVVYRRSGVQREDGLLALEEFRASLDGRDLQGATIANAILVVTADFL